MKIVVITPTYNEKVNMERMIPLLEREVFPTIKNHDMYILVADDRSPDGTAELVQSFMKKWKNISLLFGDKKGLGDAYIRAMKYAMGVMKADAVIEFDADFQHDPHDIPRLIKAMDEGFDYVIGSRYIKKGEIPKEWGIHRKIQSIFGNLFARVVLLLPQVHDVTSGLKLTKTEFLKKVDLDNIYSRYYAYKLQILFEVIKNKAKVKEIPIIFYERKEGSSKLEKKDLFDSFYVVLRLRFRESKRFVKFLIVGGTGFIVQLLMQELSILTGVAFLLAVWVIGFDLPFGVRDVPKVGNSIAVGIGAESAIISNFLINNFWTFHDTRKLKEKSPVLIRMLKFNIMSLLSIIVQVLTVSLMILLLGTHIKFFNLSIPTRIVVLLPTIAAIVIPLNYFIYNKIIWKTHFLKNEDNKKA